MQQGSVWRQDKQLVLTHTALLQRRRTGLVVARRSNINFYFMSSYVILLLVAPIVQHHDHVVLGVLILLRRLRLRSSYGHGLGLDGCQRVCFCPGCLLTALWVVSGGLLRALGCC